MPNLQRMSEASNNMIESWWALMPTNIEWTRSRVIWSRVVNAQFQELTLVTADGQTMLGQVSPELQAAMNDYREAVSDPKGGWFTALEMTLSREGEMQLHVIWNDQVWFGMHPDAPLQPPTDPEAGQIPTPEMWARELELHPRDEDRIPEWWKAQLAIARGEASPDTTATVGEPAQTAADQGSESSLPAVKSVAEALRAPVRLPASFAMMPGAWGWDRVADDVNTAVTGAIEKLGQDAQERLFGSDAQASQQARDELIRTAKTNLREATFDQWAAGTAVRLLREWNSRHAGEDPADLSAVDQTQAYQAAVRSNLAMKRVHEKLETLMHELLETNVRDRLDGLSR